MDWPQFLARHHRVWETTPKAWHETAFTGPGSGGRALMAKIIIGGQMLCLLLTLLVTPIAYSIFDDWGTKLPAFLGRLRKPHADATNRPGAPASGPAS